MVKRERIDTAEVPGGGTMELWRQGRDWSIWVAGEPLMTSSRSGSEEALAELGCRSLGDRPEAEVLVGGLGMGFTLAEALRRSSPTSRVTVSELVPAVERWNRAHLGGLAGHPLDDPRTRVDLRDVALVLEASPGRFDAVLLDVDNGPSALTQEANGGLYRPTGLARIRRALRPGGTVAIWSAYADPAFGGLLQRAGFRVEEHAVGAHRKRGSRHVIWTGQRT